MAKQKTLKSVLARQDDGTVQLTITIPYSLVQEKREEALNHMIQGLEVPGFRKGKVPQDVALKHVEQQELTNHMLQHLLPEVYTQAAEEHKLQPIIAPRFELLSIKEGEAWTVRVITCELPEITLGDYRKAITGSAKAGTRDEKEQQVLKSLLEITQARISKLLIDEEVNRKLSQLLDQLQKLGVSIEQYLKSTGKNIEQLKQEYTKQAEEAIKLEVVLNKIAESEVIGVEDKEIDAIIEASGSEEAKKALSTDSQKRVIKQVLYRRKALDRLVAMI